jgi:hypothetical protein
LLTDATIEGHAIPILIYDSTVMDRNPCAKVRAHQLRMQLDVGGKFPV